MKLKFLFITLFICSLSWSQNKGTISGVILDKDLNNEPLSFANITLKGTTTGTSTDAEGKYIIEVTAGNYTLVISFLGYETVEIPCIVKENEITTINKTIGSGSVSLSDVVVKSTVNREKETALMLEQKNAVVIKQSIGAQEMSRKGVSDVEEGLTKITGITKVDARGIFVRGLEDRYNNLLINNLAAPTNNPFKKIIPLDLFSTDIVGVIDVYKTFNPNIYGDFAGGTFDVSTSTGNKSITKLSLGTGFTTNNSLEDFLISDDANNTKGFFGFNGKTRELPSILQGKKPSGYTFTTPDSQKYFKSGFNVADTKSPLNTSIGVLHAEKFELKNDAKFSYLFSLNFDNEYAIKKGADRTFDSSNTGFEYITNFNSKEYLYKTSSTSLLNLNYNVKKFKFSSNTIFIQTTENSIKDQKGSPRPGFDNQLIRTNQFTKTDYLNTQLSAEYAISENQTFKIAGSTAKTKYAQPDRKFFTGAISPTNNTINTFYGGNNFLRQYLAIDGDYYFSTLAEYNLKFGNKEHQNKLTLGYNGNNSSMQSSYRFIQSESQLAYFINPDINNIDTQIQSDLTNGLFNFKESSNGTYKVKLAEMANAGYANLLWKFNSKLEINAGLRFENTLKETKYRTLGSALDPYKKIKVTNSYFLPSLNTKYAVSEKTNIRLAVSKTYTKPVIMESFPLSYVNADGTGIQGNPLLVNSDNYNGDLKIEFFPTSKEMFAFGVFGKYLKNPIERINISNATTGTITSFLNSDNAKVYGIEAEFVLALERLNQNLSNFTLGFNTTLMNSDVKVNSKYKTQDENGVVTETATIETHKSRKLQGASNFLVNSDLKYQFNFSKNWSNTASLVYSAFSKRIYAVGTVYQDHTYEIPYNQLDFVWSSKFNNHIDLKFTIDNITNPLRSLQLGNNGERPIAESDNTLKSYKRGTGFSLKLNYTF
jgi:TonB-dependent receptor